jgi:secreted PhoX family phosphatase
VLAYKNNEFITVADHLIEPDQLAIDRHSNLWIAEDADPGRILRVRNGKSEIIVSGLASPQGLVFDRRGRLYVAEQGKNRILLFTFSDRK